MAVSEEYINRSLKKLPIWYRVAFAARYARHLEPFYSQWPGRKYMEAIREAISFAETVAINESFGDIDDLAVSAIHRAAIDAARRVEASSVDASDYSTREAGFRAASAASAAAAAAYNAAAAVHAFAAATDTADVSDAEGFAYAAASAYSAYSVAFSFHRSNLFADDEHLGREIRRDLVHLQQSTVDLAAFFESPRWVPGECDDSVHDLSFLPLTIYVERGTAPDEKIAELLSEISALYRMTGGSGITFELSGVVQPRSELALA